MKISELIKKLEQYDANLEIEILDNNYGFEEQRYSNIDDVIYDGKIRLIINM